MNKTLEKILEDELFDNETFEGEGSLQIKNTSEGTKLPIILEGNSCQETDDTKPSPDNPSEIKNCEKINFLVYKHNLLADKWAQDLLDRLGIQSSDPNNCITEIDGHRYFKYNASLGYQTGLTYFVKGCFKESTRYTFKCVLMRDNDALSPNISFKYTDGTSSGWALTEIANMKRVETRTTSLEGKTISYIGINFASGSTFIDLDNCILYEGTEDLLYEEYGKTYSFPAKEGQVFHKGDYLADDGTHHKKITIEVEGADDENWKETDALGDKRMMLNNIPRPKYSGVTSLLSTHFKSVQSLYSGNCFITGDKSGIHLGNTNTSDKSKVWENVDALKQFLKEQKAKETPVKFEYELEEEIIEPYSEEQKEAHKQLMQATAYDDVTNIICTDEITCGFKVNAKISKMKKLIERENANV